MKLKEVFRLNDINELPIVYNLSLIHIWKGDKFKAFDPLYGTHHKFYGAMDYFDASAWQGVAPGLQLSLIHIWL